MNRGKQEFERYGIVAFSFALRSENEEPNPCNVRLARNVERALSTYEDRRVVVVAQWEVARALEARGIPVDRVVGPRADQRYLGSEDVWAEAKSLFQDQGIRNVLLVAQPLLHLPKVVRLARLDAFAVIPFKVDAVGFDNTSENTQWWTRGPIRLAAYAILQVLAGVRDDRRTKRRV